MAREVRTAGLLHHVEIYVSDLEKTTQFWGWLLGALGYREYQKWPQGVSYINGPTYIVFVQTAERFLDIPYHRCRVGLNHLAFHAESREFVDEIAKQLRARRIPILYEARHPHAGGTDSYVLFFEDPDRIKVEVVAT